MLEEIYTAGGHFDVDTLLHRMKQRGAKVSRATLYNTIELFLEAGLVRKHRFGEQSQYEPGFPAYQRPHHPRAGAVGDRIQQIKATLEDHFGIEILHALHIYAREELTHAPTSVDLPFPAAVGPRPEEGADQCTTWPDRSRWACSASRPRA